MSENEMCYNLKCVARAATLLEAPSRLRLSVREPRWGCLPWCSKKRTVATLCFKEAHWQQGASGEYEQTAECGVKDLAKLKRLEADLPVKVKCWTKGRPSKLLLQVSLGVLLDQLEGSPASEAWLAFTATGQEQRLSWQPAGHQNSAGADLPQSHDALEDSEDMPLGYDDLWDSGDEEIPMEEDLSPETPAPCVAEDGKATDGEWVTFFNPSTGMTLRLPRHTEEEAAEEWQFPWSWTSQNDLSHTENKVAASWQGPGAWTSEDDLLSPRALRIVAGIRPVVKRSRLPEVPQWWEQASTGTAAAAPVTLPAQQVKQQDTSLLPPDWNLPTFSEYNAALRSIGGADVRLPEVTLPAPRRRGVADAGPPEVTQPALRRCDGAVRDIAGRRPGPLQYVVVALVYVIYVMWVVTCGDDFLNAIAARVDNWLNYFSV